MWRTGDMTQKEKKYYDLVRSELTNNLLKKEYKDRKVNHKYYGHCFHATHALYHLLEGKKNGYKIRKAIDELGVIHYWLESPKGEIIDPTKEQYTELCRKFPYNNKKDNRASYREPGESKIIRERVMKKLGQ